MLDGRSPLAPEYECSERLPPPRGFVRHGAFGKGVEIPPPCDQFVNGVINSRLFLRCHFSVLTFVGFRRRWVQPIDHSPAVSLPAGDAMCA